MIEDVFYYTHNKYGLQRDIERHQIKFHELTFLLDGVMTYYINDEKFDMVSGDIIYLPAGSMRRRDVCKGMNNYVSINFHCFDELPLKHFMNNGINDEVRMLLEYLDMIYISRQAGINPQKLVHTLETLVLQLSDNLLSTSKPPLANEIANYLSRHYRERISLEDISRETYFSVAYCESEFKKAYGKSIIHYLIDIRVSEAKALLVETSLSCSVIAEMVGFDDANYFSRIFKKRIGFSPLQYRNTVFELNKSPL